MMTLLEFYKSVKPKNDREKLVLESLIYTLQNK